MNVSDVFDRPTPDLQGRNDASATEAVSAALNLSVMKPSSRDARLPRPAIADAHGDELDLDSFRGDTTITCMPWPLIAVGQKVWLVVDGSLADGSATTLPLWTASGVTASQVGNGLNKALPRSWLESLRNGSSIAVKLHVSFDGSTDKARSVELPALNLTVRVSEFNLVDDFDKYALGKITKERPLDFLYYITDDPSPWSVVTAPSGLNGRCLRLLISSSQNGPYSYLHLTPRASELLMSIVEFTYIVMSGANSSPFFIIRKGLGFSSTPLIVDRQPHTIRVEVPNTLQTSLSFGNSFGAPGTLDLYLDNLKIKTP